MGMVVTVTVHTEMHFTIISNSYPNSAHRLFFLHFNVNVIPAHLAIQLQFNWLRTEPLCTESVQSCSGIFINSFTRWWHKTNKPV